MAKSICVLNPHEAELLRQGCVLNCKSGHRHVSRDTARAQVKGIQHGYQVTSFRGEARWAILPDGTESEKHIVSIEAKEWRKVTPRSEVYLGIATMQLVALKRGRRRESLEV